MGRGGLGWPRGSELWAANPQAQEPGKKPRGMVTRRGAPGRTCRLSASASQRFLLKQNTTAGIRSLHGVEILERVCVSVLMWVETEAPHTATGLGRRAEQLRAQPPANISSLHWRDRDASHPTAHAHIPPSLRASCGGPAATAALPGNSARTPRAASGPWQGQGSY